MEIPSSLEEIVHNICELKSQIAFLRGQELDAEMTAYLSSTESSIEARKRAGKYASATFSKEIWKLEAELESTTEWKFYLLRKLNNAQQN